MLGVDISTLGRVRNSSDLGVCLSSMPVDWIGRVVIRVLSRRSRGDFPPIDAKSTSCSTSSPTSPGIHLKRIALAEQVPLSLKFARVQFRITIGWADVLPRGSKPGVAGDTGGTVGAGRRRMLGVVTLG